jgi:hypothetical protein
MAPYWLWRRTMEEEKGIAMVQQNDGSTRLAEIHWYEAHGIGKVKLKIKRWL